MTIRAALWREIAEARRVEIERLKRMIHNAHDRQLVYQCGMCNRVFLAFSPWPGFEISCPTNHYPPSCCHYNETSLGPFLDYDLLKEVLTERYVGAFNLKHEVEEGG